MYYDLTVVGYLYHLLEGLNKKMYLYPLLQDHSYTQNLACQSIEPTVYVTEHKQTFGIILYYWYNIYIVYGHWSYYSKN